MPIYEYRCENGHLLEVMQKVTDDPVTRCEDCQAPVQRVFHPIAVHFKGSGFYTTDYGSKRKGDSTGGDSDAKKPEGDGKKSEQKSETKSESKSGEKSGSKSD